jgi:hypothetical protein
MQKKDKGKHPGGAPTKYEDRFADMAYVACKEGGFTDAKLAKLFGVCRATISNWKVEHPEFLDTVKRGKDFFDCDVVEAALLKISKGFKYKEITQEPTIEKVDGERVITDPTLRTTKIVKKTVVPDTRAIQFFLCNRNPDRWKMKNHTELTGPGGGAITVYTNIPEPKPLPPEEDIPQG